MKKWPFVLFFLLALVGVRLIWTRGHPHEEPAPAGTDTRAEARYSLDDLGATDPLTRAQAARWMAQAPPGEEGRPPVAALLPVLMERLHKEHNEHVRPEVSWALSKSGVSTAAPLLDELHRQNRRTRMEAAAWFGLALPTTAAFGYQLAEEQQDTQQFVLAVGSALGQMKQEVLPILLEALKDPDGGFVKAGAAIGLAYMGPRAADAVPGLMEWLKLDDDMVAGPICHALGQIGRPAIADLRRSLKDPNPRVRANAALALAVAVEGRRFSTDLGQLNAPELEYERRQAKKEALPELKAALNDADPRVRLYVALALQDQGDQEQAATIPVLRELNSNSDPFIRQTSAEILRRIDISKQDTGARSPRK